ncbi:MAG TPA: fumarylacetoacetate hydrolase family protein [Ardenticatenaceae bacterium]|jgi:fumarylacetoacetate (FAA) hydrolase
MRLVSYRHSAASPRVALLDGERVIDLERALGLPPEMLSLLRLSTRRREADDAHPLDWLARAWEQHHAQIPESAILTLDVVHMTAPLPNPTSLRDFYAFEQHVKQARARRGLEMIPEWYEMPVFYFSNHQAILGPGDTVRRPGYTEWLDFELEVAAIIGREGRDIPVEEAESYIAGYTIMNDWSARDVQRREMKVGLGPAKAKDFATSLGPWLVTPDELADRLAGKGFNLQMVARRNGQELSRGNWQTLYYSFAEMIARASEEVTLYPGDVIGSGTVGTGCILELGPEMAGGWLQPGDVIELEIERLGMLRNVV